MGRQGEYVQLSQIFSRQVLDQGQLWMLLLLATNFKHCPLNCRFFLNLLRRLVSFVDESTREIVVRVGRVYDDLAVLRVDVELRISVLGSNSRTNHQDTIPELDGKLAEFLPPHV